MSHLWFYPSFTGCLTTVPLRSRYYLSLLWVRRELRERGQLSTFLWAVISDLPSQTHVDQSISATIRIPCRRVLNGTSSYTDDTYILLILSPDTRLIQFLPRRKWLHFSTTHCWSSEQKQRSTIPSNLTYRFQLNIPDDPVHSAKNNTWGFKNLCENDAEVHHPGHDWLSGYPSSSLTSRLGGCTHCIVYDTIGRGSGLAWVEKRYSPPTSARLYHHFLFF